MNNPMNELLKLRDLMAGAEVPNGVLGINCNFGRFEVHVREEDFRATFKEFSHHYHSNYRGRTTYRIQCVSEGVMFYAITDERPETDAEIVSSEHQYDRQANLAQVRDEALDDLVARARSNW